MSKLGDAEIPKGPIPTNQDWLKAFRNGEWEKFINLELPNYTSGAYSEQQTFPWQEEGYLIPHEPLRRDLVYAARVLQAKYFDGTVQWKVRNFYRWYRDFCHIVHHHHDAEEKILFPNIVKKAPVPEKCSADHVELLEIMDAITSYEKKFVGSDDQKRKVADDLRTSWRKFVELMLPHLEEEEVMITPIVLANFTSDEYNGIVQKIVKDLGPSGNAVMLPWIVDALSKWAGPGGIDRFYSKVPPPVVAMNKKVWIYQGAYRAKLLRSLQLDADPKLKFPGFVKLIVTPASKKNKTLLK